MGIHYIRPLAGRESSIGLVTEYEQEREFLCFSDSRYENDYTITAYGWANNILPIPFVSWSSSVNGLISLLCRSLQIKQDKKSPQHYVITAKWSSAPLGQPEKEAQQDPNPLDRPPKFHWKSNKYTKPAVYDTGNNLILNSAFDPFDPPPEIDQSRFTVTIVQNVDSIPPEILSFCDAVNSTAFTIQGITIAPQVAKIMDIDIPDIQVTQVGDEEIAYVPFSYSMELRPALVARNSGELEPEGWTLRLLDQGIRQIDPNDDTKRIPIFDDAVPPKEVKKPWPLDGFGAKLANPKPDTAQQRVFDVYNYIPFDNLPGINT